MADLNGYQQWLAKHQRQPAFINSHWCVMLAHEMDENKLLEGFNIPYFIAEEQLTKEDNNVNSENKDTAYISPALSHWLVHLLKSFSEQATLLNYEEVLREFLEKEDILPIGIARPLTPSTSFHNLPSECKLWILYALWRNKTGKPQKALRTVSKDPLGNSYYLIADGRLYVRLASTDIIALPIDEEQLKDQPWGSLYRFVHAQPCKLLCDSSDSWEVVKKAFLSFKLNNLYYSINQEMTVKLCARSVIMIMREGHRTEFENVLTRLGPVPRARQVKYNKINNVSGGYADVNAIQTHLGAMDMSDCAPPAEVKKTLEKKSRKRTERCRNFPKCPLEKGCQYVHPNTQCKKFPNCPFGWQCTFLHDFCLNDGYCVEPNCAYEHHESQPTYYRLPRGPDAENPRPIASVTPLTRKLSNQSMIGATEDVGTLTAAATATNEGFTKKRRCQYFPQCRRGDACTYIHPTLNCRNFPMGKSCPGQWCLFKHGPCPNDGGCKDLQCVYEHYKSKPVIMRKPAPQKNRGSLSRAASTSNLSTCSGRSRKKSVTFGNDSDDESCGAKKKDSTEHPPAGILRPSDPSDARETCRFRRKCTRQETCGFVHPTQSCPAFPKCPNGGACKFLHEMCKNDGVCFKVNCDCEHNLPHDVGVWCKKGSLCTRVGCKFIHPEGCAAPCPTPGNCWMYHRPAPAVRPPLIGPGMPGFGYGPANHGVPPPFTPTPIRYGFGPDFSYRPPPGPGYGQGPMMGPGFPPSGPGPMYPRGNGGYRPRSNNEPHAPPRGPPHPTTPGHSPPPPPY